MNFAKYKKFFRTVSLLKKPFVFLVGIPLVVKVINFFNAYKVPLSSGLLFGLSFIPFPFFTLFFALVPLWFFICHQSRLQKVIIGCLICQALATFIGFNWIIYTFHSFGGMNWFFSFIMLVLFCCFANIYILLSGVLWFLLSKKSSLFLPVSVKLLLFPLIFSLLHSLIPTFFPWDMGYPWLWGGMPGAHTAELWGFRFLGTLFYIFNLLFLIVYKHRFDKTGKRALAGALLLFAGLNLLGFYLKWRLPQPDKFLNAIVIQNNIGSIAHLDARSPTLARKKAFHISKTLTYKAVLKHAGEKKLREDIDFILWSEGSYGWTINKRQKKEYRLSKMIKELQIPFITGAVSRDQDKYGGSLFVFDRNGNILKPVYNKIKLLIFGEYFPGIDRIPFLRRMFPYFGSSFIPGKDVQVQQLEDTRYGWQICYESLFDTISRKLAQEKAQVLVNITNDSWYGSWQEPWQHLSMNFARAIEVRRPLLRSTNTGYSGLIHADGTVDRISPLNKRWFHLYKIPYYKNPPETLFMSWGYYINEMFLFILSLFVCIASLRQRFILIPFENLGSCRREKTEKLKPDQYKF